VMIAALTGNRSVNGRWFSDVTVIDSQARSIGKIERRATQLRSSSDDGAALMTLLVTSIIGLLMSSEDASRAKPSRSRVWSTVRRRNVNRLTHAIDNRRNFVAEATCY